ncbi:palm2 and akap2 fusion isoform X3 [Denticeps clupeoides]|uniref:A-kinase anchor protein 2-like n=2 Tax=Denticeps clupeoides TaxID=299321 RepID=A0AAY4ADY0_9TELE|nr:A-kinase anchor protein 2-like isoform X3 [Denticeps clupeoides]XP_028826879.1 A-kinase anchor protein 2-like isoform X3 [Denticeps clupeoides]XP_028826880.1 A-kinase anchor protein 2-like isoform X3 [Denticeps clupeoides]
MAEAELHKERLQALAEKRKRQAEIEDKRRQLDDLVMQLQHLRSKAMRERWLLQGTSAMTQEEEDSRRKQVEQDELHVKKLEDAIHRLESEIGLLENEESQISAKEQVLRERLRETERSIEDLQKSLLNQDGDAVNYVCPQIPDLPQLNSSAPATAFGDKQLPRKPALYAMEISVEKDRKTGGTKILSASPVTPEEVHQRGVKVYDDGHRVVYEVHSGGTATLENGIHPWSTSEVDELMQRVSQPHHRGDAGRVTVTPAEHEVTPPVLREQTLHKEAKLEMVRGQQGKSRYDEEVAEAPEASTEKPVTMIFMGYHSVEDEEETKKLLGFDGTIKAEIVLIDEDDEKSLREKTVTDISTMDGNAADLVSGRPLSDSTELSSEGKDESAATKELPDTGTAISTAENGDLSGRPTFTYHKSSKFSEDDSELRRERRPKSVTFLDGESVISERKDNMEVEAQADSQYNCYAASGQNGVRHKGEALDTEVAQEIRYLDEVLEANCCEPGSEITSNGTSSPDLKPINIDGNRPSVHVSEIPPSPNSDVIIEGRKQTTFVSDDNITTKPNGHSAVIGQRSGEPPATARFELRAFHEEKKPSKLFEGSTEKEIRVKKIRPSEEIAELERERLELIRGQAVKKNPGIAAKWWNPPQEKTLEEELEPEKLESLRRYEERKQKKPESTYVPQTVFKHVSTTFTQQDPVKREDIVVEQIDFSAARKQFLQMEHTKQSAGTKRGVAPQLYSAKPFSRTSEVTHVERPSGSVTFSSLGHSTLEETCDVATVRTEPIYCFPGDSRMQHLAEGQKTWTDDFTCARAVMTVVKDEDTDMYPPQQSTNSSYHPEEIDSGLDDLSLRSQDTTVLETLSNDFSMDNVSDSGTSNETMSAILENSLGDYSFPPTPVATTPVNGKLEGGTKSPSEHSVSLSFQGDSLTEDELEYHAGVLVQNAIQQAIAQQSDEWEPREVTQQSSPIPERHVEVVAPSPPPAQEKLPSPILSPRVPSPVEQNRITTPPIRIQAPVVPAVPVVPVNTYKPPSPSPPPAEKPEFSYFSKYSEAAELRSTASVTRAQDTEVSAGPFKLRSRKQRTLSMIEEEIRAAQEREEELKKQRQRQNVCPMPTARQKTNSLPAKLVLPGKTAPGKIEKIRTVPPASPCSSDGPLPSPLSDQGSDDSGGQRPKNFMQTLMEDFETHKVKRREKMEDNSYAHLLLASDVTSEVMEATRVTRRKSNMALRWEAGIYANQGEAEEEEEEEEEE